MVAGYGFPTDGFLMVEAAGRRTFRWSPRKVPPFLRLPSTSASGLLR